LTAGDPIKNASAILRYALPIDNKPIRKVQRDLELIAEALRIPGSKSLGPVAKAVRSSQSVLTKERNAIINDFAPDKKEAGLAGLERLDQGLIVPGPDRCQGQAGSAHQAARGAGVCGTGGGSHGEGIPL
jgi:hypothetical protein